MAGLSHVSLCELFDIPRLEKTKGMVTAVEDVNVISFMNTLLRKGICARLEAAATGLGLI